ncbi:hypothetical protein FOZ62_028883 [Perkinsus olseni]|uniref:Uncharacterized protein n=1 Tax=Perkinsus olseni TaxID=32597 RepID=A0A7J6TDP5_PEROL|nr:hypothetical protein FOZ62_028883 [Perkinsus olseni]
MVVRAFLDLTNQWDSESTYPFLVLSRMAYDTEAVVQKVEPITLSLFFTIKRVYAMYNTIFWRTQWNYYTHRNEYGIVQSLEKGFDHQAFQVFKKYEPYLQFLLVDGVATEGMLEAIPYIKKAYCYTKGSYGKDGWKSWGKDDGAEGAQGFSSEAYDAKKVDKEFGSRDQQDNSKAEVDTVNLSQLDTEGTPGYGGSSSSKDAKLTEGDDFKSVEGDDDVEKKVHRRRHSKKKDKKKKRRSRHRMSRRRYYSDDESPSSSISSSSSSSD